MQIEYRVENIHFAEAPEAGSLNNQLVTKLNEWGAEGWRVVHVDLSQQQQWGPLGRPVLLAREIGNRTSEPRDS